MLNKGVVAQSSICGIKDGDKDDVGGIIGRIVAILEEGKKRKSLKYMWTLLYLGPYE